MWCFHDGLICGVEAGRFLAALTLLLLGLSMIGCGANACWLRLRGRRGQQSRAPYVKW